MKHFDARRTLRRRGLSAVEMLATLVVVGVVVTSSAAMLHALSRTGTELSAVGEQRTTASLALMRLRRELRLATAVSVLAAHDIEFTHPDMDADGDTETIRYTWSGTAGQPLTRTYNGTAQTLVASCNQFDLQVEVDATVGSGLTTLDTAEMKIASFDSYAPLAYTTSAHGCSTARLNAETFTPTYTDAVALEITKVEVFLKKVTTTVPGNVLVSIRPVQPSTVNPSTTKLAEVSKPANSLTTTGQYELFAFSNCSDLTPGSSYCMVVTTDQASIVARDEYQTLTLTSVDNGAIMRGTTDGGSTWTPTVTLHTADIRFAVWGIFTVQTGDPDPPIVSGTLNVVHVALTTTDGDTEVALHGGTECLNRPDLAGFRLGDLPVVP